MRHFDCIVIGTGPAGQKAAIQAAKLGKSVAIIEKKNVLGGASINTGTIPSKALREAVLHLTGASKRGLFGETSRVKRNITIADLIYVSQQVIHQELDLIQEHFDRNGIELIWGAARFHDDTVLYVDRPNDFEVLSGERFIICTGTRPAKPESVPFNKGTIFTSDGLLKLETLPKTMIVVGGGVIGVEYACMLATLGVKVTLVEGRNEVLGFLDHEITEAFQYQMRRMGITLRLGEKVAKIEEISPDHPEVRAAAAVPTATAVAAAANDPSMPPVPVTTDSKPMVQYPTTQSQVALVQATLESGKHLRAQALLYAVGRQGTTVALDLEKVGLARRRSRAIEGQRALSNRSRAHLRRRRCDRLPRAGQHRDGAGPAGGLSCLRRADQFDARAVSLRHLRDPRNLDGRQDRRAAHRTPASRTKPASPNTANSPAASCSATTTACSSS